MQGIIALDIDGTITGPDHQVPEEVRLYLKHLADEGWSLIFITGRTFSFGYDTLKVLDFPYHFGVYNGAVMLKMPEMEVVVRHYLPGEVVDLLVGAMEPEGLDPLIHTGVEFGDHCYWRPKQFDEATQAYLRERRDRTTEPWEEVESFDHAPVAQFAYAKVFGDYAALERIEQRLTDLDQFAISRIQDPLRPSHGLLMIADPAATKGGTLCDFRLLAQKFYVIAGGDDRNDMSMLEEANVAIAIETAPEEVRALADIVVPQGRIIDGIQQAMEKSS